MLQKREDGMGRCAVKHPVVLYGFMIGWLRGILKDTGEESLLMDVGGVGYEIFCSSRLITALPAAGGMVELVIETHVREDHIHLYGFADRAEREWFRTLTTVQGVGVRVALAILGAMTPEKIAQAIAAQDKTAFTRISGIGPKLGERLITELKSKVAKLPASFSPAGTVVPLRGKKGAALSASDEAISALVNLGYNRSEAFIAVSKAALQTEGASLDGLIKSSLKELAG
jgi:Holliday junction DNA helicase RuvA